MVAGWAPNIAKLFVCLAAISGAWAQPGMEGSCAAGVAKDGDVLGKGDFCQHQPKGVSKVSKVGGSSCSQQPCPCKRRKRSSQKGADFGEARFR
jgi:hypothetical protein